MIPVIGEMMRVFTAILHKEEDVYVAWVPGSWHSQPGQDCGRGGGQPQRSNGVVPGGIPGWMTDRGRLSQCSRWLRVPGLRPVSGEAYYKNTHEKNMGSL